MSRGKHLSLEEARRTGQLARYAKEHPSKGDRDAFNRVLKGMASGKKPSEAGTSGEGSSSGSSDTRFRHPYMGSGNSALNHRLTLM